MSERPIIMTGPSIPAILDGSKTQTRRLMSPQPAHLQRHEWNGKLVYEGEHRLWCWKRHTFDNIWDFGERNEERKQLAKLSPYGVVGDRLWCKEAWDYFGGNEYLYQQDPGSVLYRERDDNSVSHGQRKWRSPLFMPRWASRITLELVDVRVQRLQEITEADARAEGVSFGTRQPVIVNGEPGHVAFFNAHDAFAYRWAALHGRDAWRSNPFVWALTFRRIP